MKKFASIVAAGAILMSTYGIAFAYESHHSRGSVYQFSFTKSETAAVSDTGSNTQVGGNSQYMTTGGSGAEAGSLTAGNDNLGGRTSVRQGAFTSSLTAAESYTGNNTQVAATEQNESRSRHHHDHDDNTVATTQSMVTGGSGASAGSITVSNLNLSFH